MLARRRDSDRQQSAVEQARDAVVRLYPVQSQFSIASAALPAALLLTMFADLLIGHPHFNRGAVAIWVLMFLLLSALPLCFGERYPQRFGLLLVAFLTFWSVFSLVNSSHPHMELNAFLLSPMVAVYLGWFYNPWLARIVLYTHLLAVAVATLVRPANDQYTFSSDLALLYAVLISALCVESAAQVRARADRESWHDQLTGVLNRRGLVEKGGQAIARAQQLGLPLSLAVVDLDDFKAVNDTGGHAAGDRALRIVSGGWVEDLGPQDLVGRSGGDEFVLVLHEDEGSAEARLSRLRRVATHPWSWGLVGLHPGDSFDELVKRADDKLYVQKRSRGA